MQLSSPLRSQPKAQPRSKIHSVWKDGDVPTSHHSGVSLHSHTSMSEETLTFVHKFLALLPGL